MGLEYTGEVLTVQRQEVKAGKSADGSRSWDAFTSITVQMFADGRVTDFKPGNDLDMGRLAEVERAVNEGHRPVIRAGCFVFKGRLYLTEILDAKVPAPAGK